MKKGFLLTFCLLLTLTLSAERKKALVTGGAGFLGSHMCEHLLKNNYEVICLDNFQSGTIENIKHLTKLPYFSYIKHDVIDPLPIGIKVDEIYNFACSAEPKDFQKDPIHTMKTCVIGAINVIELGLKCNAKIFQASTSEIYGNPDEHPQKESYWGHVNPLGSRSCYDEGKRSAETLFFDYYRTKKAKIKVARIFNIYGPRMTKEDGRVISNFINQCLEGKPITIYGSGSQTRSFCYVSDAIEAIYAFMQTSDTETGPLNIGNPDEHNIEDIAHQILKMTSSPSIISFQEIPEEGPKKKRPDISLAYKLFKWKPKVSFEDGLKKTIEYYQEKKQREQKTESTLSSVFFQR